MTETELTIKSLGHRGDGIAEADKGPVYVAGALPGETVSAEIKDGRAKNIRYLKQSADRIAPVCHHYAKCGGCSLQHLAEEPYLDWKRDLVARAFQDRGIAHPVSPTRSATAGGRRRAVFSATRAGRHTLLGYHEKASQRLVDVTECPVLAPGILKALPGLRKLVSDILPRKGDIRITVLETTSGLDVAIEKADKAYERKIPALSQNAVALDLARLTINGETLLETRPPVLDMDGLSVAAAPGGFTQATLAGELLLSRMVLEDIGKVKSVADLFCGIGTFALRIAKLANVHAVEGDAAAIAAIDKTIRRSHGLKKVTFERRDLFRRPLMKEDLKAFDAVVFDPPRAGAQVQAEQLAQSKVKTVIAVSCNPATLARDAKLLIDGGYSLKSITPVDQFQYSPHIEVVAKFER